MSRDWQSSRSHERPRKESDPSFVFGNVRRLVNSQGSAGLEPQGVATSTKEEEKNLNTKNKQTKLTTYSFKANI